ncbi:MEKHLA domain-containing protein [Streptomyces sp. NPDC090106]|uniref:MEKHLA domain-containing protein n=1 Tax=Streptomyces sp. NPDC090106 TaxID=3365946 RepID=UPI003811B328
MISVPTPLDPAFFSLLSGSYERLLGRPLVPETSHGTHPADWLYHDAPFAVLVQDGGDDPAFVYANITAQRCFSYSWHEFSGLRSSLSAPIVARAERDHALSDVLRDSVVEGYRGLRISGTGRRFWIEDVTIWNLAELDGVVHGQAALIPSWSDV